MSKNEGDEGLRAISSIHFLLIGILALILVLQLFVVFLKVVGFLTLAGGAAAGIGWMPTAFRMGAAEPLMNSGPGAGSGLIDLIFYAVSSLAETGFKTGILYVSARGLKENYAVGWYTSVAIYTLTLVFVNSIIIRLISLVILYILWNERNMIDFNSKMEVELREIMKTLREDIEHFRTNEIDEIISEPRD